MVVPTLKIKREIFACKALQAEQKGQYQSKRRSEKEIKHPNRLSIRIIVRLLSREAYRKVTITRSLQDKNHNVNAG